MTLFRLFLVGFLIVLTVYTAIVGFNYGWNLVPVFFAEIAAMTWQGQFNLDFMGFLLLSAIWTAWRNAFSVSGFGLSLLAATGGMMFLTIYLLFLSFQTKGDIREIMLGSSRA
ncbi:MAG: hypothetical protein P8H62_03930 [Henriciella sp.]|jgi:hypothetical protein|nr:hypothetical protein [Henriciella sp.]